MYVLLLVFMVVGIAWAVAWVAVQRNNNLHEQKMQVLRNSSKRLWETDVFPVKDHTYPEHE